MNCRSVPGKVKSFSISLRDWLKSLKSDQRCRIFKRPQENDGQLRKTRQQQCICLFHSKNRLQPFPISTCRALQSHQGAARFEATVCTIDIIISMPLNKMKSESCMFHSHRVITEMGKALSLHLKAFHQKPIRLNIPAGKWPSLSERECCDRILN